MAIKFQYNGYTVECDTPEEAKGLMNVSDKARSSSASPSTRNRTTVEIALGKEHYQSLLKSLNDNAKKTVIAIGSQAQISMGDVARITGANNNMTLSAWITASVREAKKHGIQQEQLWEKRGPRGNVKFTPTPILRAAVESMRDGKLSAVKQTA